jgi:hypothetical protein
VNTEKLKRVIMVAPKNGFYELNIFCHCSVSTIVRLAGGYSQIVGYW